MLDKDIIEFGEKLQHGLALAERRMLEEKALRGQDIIVCDNDGAIRRIPAAEAIQSLN